MTTYRVDKILLGQYGLGDGILLFSKLITDPYFYQNKAVRFIDNFGKDHLAIAPSDIISKDELVTVKIERLEDEILGIYPFLNKLLSDFTLIKNNYTKASCHLFYACKDAPSFALHSDPVDLIILCIHGSKKMQINDEVVNIPKGYFAFIPANTMHCAINDEESVMLSIGAEVHTGDAC